MFRSILKGSFLAASFCVLAISSSAHASAKVSANSLASMDVNLSETKAGKQYAAEKKSGATCPFAKKGNLNEVTVADASGTGHSTGGLSNGRTVIH